MSLSMINSNDYSIDINSDSDGEYYRAFCEFKDCTWSGEVQYTSSQAYREIGWHLETVHER